jgi:hypothetical protein
MSDDIECTKLLLTLFFCIYGLRQFHTNRDVAITFIKRHLNHEERGCYATIKHEFFNDVAIVRPTPPKTNCRCKVITEKHVFYSRIKKINCECLIPIVLIEFI